MSAVNRIFAVFKKDVFWAVNNLKLLTIMILPVFIVVLFSQMDGEATFVFAITFVNAFVGLFTMSYLIIEEKNKGTLLALLTSPLKSHELLISKYLFTLILCLGFSAIAASLNGRMDVIANPIRFANLILFAGTTCFYGYITGLFFRNEQEMSIFAPLLMFLFVIGESINRASSSGDLFAYFPNYHFFKLISNQASQEWADILVHTGFNLLYFLVALLFATIFTRFYFANNRERRFSKTLFVCLAGAIGLCGASGFLTPKLIQSKSVVADKNGMSTFSFSSEAWAGKIFYDQTKEKVRPLLEGQIRQIYKIESLDQKTEIILGLRKADASEKTIKARSQKMHKDDSRVIIGESETTLKGSPFKRWHFFTGDKMVILVEGFCGEQLLQASLEIDKPKLKNINQSFKKMKSFLERLEPICSLKDSEGL